MKSAITGLICGCIGVLLTGCSTLQPPAPASLKQGEYQPVIDYLTPYIEREMERAKMVGLSVALVHRQDDVWRQGFGYADKANLRPVKTNTLFRAGSVSKIFTSTAVMQLVEAGKLQLDAPLADSVPEFSIKVRSGTTRGITLRNTLSHRAGLPGNVIDGMWSNQPANYRTIATRLEPYYTSAPPNHVFSYSNAGYGLAGMAVENASGQPFVDYMTSRLLIPMKMNQSNFSFAVKNPLISKSYWKNREVQELGLRDLPAGGLVTNVEDLSSMLKMINADGQSGENRILGEQALHSMLAPQTFDSPYAVKQGFGIGWFQFNSVLNGVFRSVGHGGQTLAHSALLVSVPDLKLGVVLLANSPNTTQALEKIADEILRVAYPAVTGQPLPDKSAIDAPDLPGEADAFPGRYASSFGEVDIRGNTAPYKVRAFNENFTLNHEDSGAHRLKYRLFGFIPIAPGELAEVDFWARNIKGSKVIFASESGSVDLIASELVTEAKHAEWHRRMGDYTLVNPVDTDIPILKFESASLHYADDTYYFSITQNEIPQQIPIRIIDENQAVLQGSGIGNGESLLIRTDGTLDYLGLRFKQLDVTDN